MAVTPANLGLDAHALHWRDALFAFLGSATLAQNQALRARREKLLLRKTRALPGFA